MLAKPGSGYEAKKGFEEVFSHFWSAELSQIYPALNQLEKDGLARSTTQESAQGPSRRVYKRTAQGTKELKKWLSSGPVLGKERVHYLTQVYFLANLPIKKRLEFFKEIKIGFELELANLKQIDRDFDSKFEGYPNELDAVAQCAQFTLKKGLIHYKSSLKWCDECIAVLEKTLAKA